MLPRIPFVLDLHLVNDGLQHRLYSCFGVSLIEKEEHIIVNGGS